MEEGMSKLPVRMIVTISFTFTFAFLFFSLAPPALWPLDPERAMTQYTLKKWSDLEGLPQNSVYAVIQTVDGYLWIATEEGLSRFDGVRFSVFNQDNTPVMKSNHIKCLFEDARGTLWIGTLHDGIINYQNGTFYNIPALAQLQNKAIYTIHGDTSGNIWIGTDGGGAYRYSTDGDTLSHYNTGNGLPSNSIKSLYSDIGGITWLGTMKGLCRYDPAKDAFSLFKVSREQPKTAAEAKDFDGDVINAIYRDSKENFWIGTVGSLYRMEGNSFTPLRVNPELEDVEISGITEDRDHNLWITTKNSGLIRYDGSKFSRLGKGGGFADNWILSITEDHEGSIWVGTSYSGLYRLNDEKFSTFGVKEGLADDIVFSIFEDSAGGLWFGTNSGLTRLKEGVTSTLTTRNGLSHKTVDTILEDSSGNLWVGTDEGLNRLPNVNASRFRTGSYLSDLRKHYIPSIMEDREGNLWVGTLQGAARIRGRNIMKLDQEDGLATRFVNFIHQDQKGDFWFSTLRGGLTVLRGDKFTKYSTREGLLSNSLNCIFESRKGVMWFGSGNGLNRFKDGRFASVTKKNGLFNNNIYQILEDNSGHLWMSSNKGIFKVRAEDLNLVADGKREQLVSIAYGRSDGMRTHECIGGYRGAGIRTRDGRLWFPTMKGAVVIHPARIKTNKIPPPVHIEGILLDGESIDLSQPIVVKPGIKQLEIHYTALSLVKPDKVKFKYKLEGFNEDWLNAGTRRTAWYTNLDGGEYRFRVAAANNDGVWNSTGSAIAISVLPPFWLTWWFITLALIAFAIFSYGVITLIRKYVSLSSFWKKQKHVGKFKLMDKIGSGGMGTVYKANNLMDKTETVALKILRDDLFEDESNRKRFKQEAAIIDQLDHPNIVKVYERGQSGQNMFIAMELLEGRTLAEKILKEKKLDLNESIHIMIQTASALGKIHARHIIHRDIKPENIMLVEKDGDINFVKLLDFGLAKMENQTRLTQTGIVIGTINYMAPEQISGKGSYAASDVYALGVIFYEMVAGEKPFPGESTVEIMKQILDKSAIEPSRFRDDLPFDLNYLIMHMLVKEWEGRPAINDVFERLKIVAMNLQSVTAPLPRK